MIHDTTKHRQIAAAPQKRRLAYVIWNFDVLAWETFVRLVDRVRKQGFTTVRLHLSWFNAEKTPGVYDFAPYDAQIAYIAGCGMDVILTVDLQRKVKIGENGIPTAIDAVIDTDEFQYACGADTYIADTMYGTAMISYAAARGTEAMVRFYRAAAEHFAAKFSHDVIAYICPTFTPYCETEYWCAGAYDYSAHMKRAFEEYLSASYADIADLNKDLGSDFASFADVPMPDDTDRGVLGVLFYQCRHKVLKSLIDRLAEAQKSVTPVIPFAVQFGCVWDAASVRRCTYAFADLSAHADLVVVDDAPGFDHAFSMDYVASVLAGSGKTFGNEIDGYYMIENGTATAEGYVEQALTSYRHGASVQYVANWMTEVPLSNYGYIFSTAAQEYLQNGRECDLATEEAEGEELHVSLLKLFETGVWQDYAEDYRAITDGGETFSRIRVHDDLTTRIYDNSAAGRDIKVDILTPEDVKKEEEKKSNRETAMAVAAIGAAALVAIGVAAVKMFFNDKDDK